MANWHRKLSVGVRQIDRHNRILYELLCRLRNASMKKCRKNRLRFEVAELLDYMSFHFACEEIWMDHANYIRVDEHQKDHSHLISLLTDMQNELISGNLSALVNLSVLIETLTIHIKEKDANFGCFLANDRLAAILMTKHGHDLTRTK